MFPETVVMAAGAAGAGAGAGAAAAVGSREARGLPGRRPRFDGCEALMAREELLAGRVLELRYADYLARVDDESAQALRDGLERSYPQGSPQAGLLAVLLSTPYQDLLKSAAQVEQRIISTLFNDMAVHVDYLQPEHELRDKNVIPALHSHVLVDMRQSVTDAGCLRAFESICASRRDSFNVRFLLLGRHETLLFAGGIVLGAKDPARQLKNLLEMVGTVGPNTCALCLRLDPCI